MVRLIDVPPRGAVARSHIRPSLILLSQLCAVAKVLETLEGTRVYKVWQINLKGSLFVLLGEALIHARASLYDGIAIWES